MLLRAGDLVRVPYRVRWGIPTARWVRVVRIEDHVPIDGSLRPQCLARLSDGSWEFIWNLERVQR
jgi:hypothetical protein